MGEDDQFRKIILENQVDAFARCHYLLSQGLSDTKCSVEDIVSQLAEAERKACFICGFEGLSKAPDVIEEIVSYMKEKQYITLDNERHMTLTEEGLTRAKKALPEPIEAYLKGESEE